MSARCYVCGSTGIAADADPRSPTCAHCRAARDHVVSMRTGPGGSAVAVCPCGWRCETRGPGSMAVREVKVRMHWHTMIRAVRAEADANIGLIFVASIAVSAALGSWLGGLS